MSAAAQRRTPLELVPDAAAPPEDNGWLTGPVEDQDLDWRARSVIDQWAPEHQLIGALMWLTAEQARPILELVPDNAIWRPRTRWAYEIIRALVDADEDPNPVTVLRRAQTQAPADARPDLPAPIGPDADRPTSNRVRRHRDLALYLFDAYSQTITPAAAGTYAREVLDEAYRRSFATLGVRMQQLAECGAERGDLTDQFAKIRDELADLWRRAETAAKTGWWRP